MLRQLKIRNFKQFLDAEFSPGGINLVVGANNAGKTTLLNALLFLSLTTRFNLFEALSLVSEPWNAHNLHFQEDTIELQATATLPIDGLENHFTYMLRFKPMKRIPADIGPPKIELVEERLEVSSEGQPATILLENVAGKVRLRHEGNATGSRPINGSSHEETTAPTDATMLFRLYEIETNRRANHFKKYLSSWLYYDLHPVRLNEASSKASPFDTILQHDGANLASVLYSLHNQRPAIERKLIELVREIEPRLSYMSFHAPDPEHVFLFFEDKLSNKFPLQSLSAGTQRFLSLAYITLGAAVRARENGFSSLIMIEEPENGIYVGLLRTLLDRIDPNGVGGQFVFSSHSPYFIDLFDDNLENLHVVRSGDKQSTVERPDPDALRERLKEFSLGELHFRQLFT